MVYYLLKMSQPQVLMIGWELPPQNSGGLGVACDGLSQALAGDGVKLDFTLPYEFKGECKHLNVIDCYDATLAEQRASYLTSREEYLRKHGRQAGPPLATYGQGNGQGLTQEGEKAAAVFERQLKLQRTKAKISKNLLQPVSEMEHQVDDYADLVLEAAVKRADKIDLIHAHDWLTIPAALKVKEELNKPLVLHIHSTEFDRTLTSDFNSYVTRTEYEGMKLADKVVAVSYYTKRLLVEKYLIDPYKIEVVHNGVMPQTGALPVEAYNFAPERPVIVFMGRLTMQKGPDYFLEMASKILANRPDALFVYAGAGDMYQDLLFRNANHGLSASVLFTNFLRGKQKDALLDRADVFVMPSVSEPFGLVAVEAVQHGTPVVISKNSGVAEVLHDTPAVDFWDIDRLVGETLHLLEDQNYKQDLVKRQQSQLDSFTWQKSAQKVEQIYQQLLDK